MELSEKIYRYLKKQDDYVSGQMMAEAFGVSRTGVWKAVKRMRERGIPVESGRTGYRLPDGLDIITASDVADAYGMAALPYDLTVLDTVTSTNDVLRDAYRLDPTVNKVLIARAQTAGRGRTGRSFDSPADCGLYMSFLLPPDYQLDKSLVITTMAAVAVSESIEEVTDLATHIKWVNDIYIGDAKVAGILTESSVNLESGRPEYIILGIGINTERPEELSEAVRPTATALFPSGGHAAVKAKLAAAIVRRVEKYYRDLADPHLVRYYDGKLYKKGQQIDCRLREKDPWTAAVVEGIDEHFRLILSMGGKRRIMSYGEFFIRPPHGGADDM
ncbi:MAG: biotin--[acetyl-CoA-carboxylase] ligase [Eubacteriales bacterium]|nr:biotin--[acetyl-CoA-carboxylase] ligase [Eubacteriales bacterium]